MTGQKQRIINRIEREAKKQLKEKGLGFNYLDTIMLSLKEIKDLIKFQGYDCGHQGRPIILDDNLLSITSFYTWCESVGWKGDRSQCWECWCKNDGEGKE